MPEIQGDFDFVRWVRPEEKIGRWEGKFASAPDADWRMVFEQELAFEGASIGSFGGISRHIDGAKITFDSPDILAKAAAEVIRRIAQKTDNRMTQLRQQQKNAEDARQKRAAELAKELKASEEKHKKL